MRAIRRGFLFLTLLTLVSSLLAQQSSTTVPNLVRYGGVLKDAQGAAMASRTVGITFLIYGQQDGGAPVWLETQNVATDAAGQYNVLLGSTTAIGLPSDLFAQQEQRWLAVKAEGQPEQPRVLLVSVPYAFKAHEAETLSGHQASEFVTDGLAARCRATATAADHSFNQAERSATCHCWQRARPACDHEYGNEFCRYDDQPGGAGSAKRYRGRTECNSGWQQCCNR